MTTIKEILQIDPSKIDDQEIQVLVKKFQEDIKDAADEELKEDDLQETIDEVYDMVKQLSPEAIAAEMANPCQDPEEAPTEIEKPKKNSSKKDRSKKERNTKKPSKSSKKKNQSKATPKMTRDEFLKEKVTLNKKAQHCKLMLKKHYAQLRELQGSSPKPTRYQKIKSHFVAIGNLIPDKLKNNLEVQQETEKILLRTHRHIIDAFGMNKLKAQKDREAIKEKYERIEEKLSKS